MSNLKEIRKRIISVKSTQQITRAMKMVSAAKFKKAQNAILKIRPYSNKIKEVLAQLSEGIDDINHNPFYQQREINRVLLIVVTSDKGLCGSFNSSIIRETMKEVQAFSKLKNPPVVELITIGKKGYDFLKKSGIPIKDKYFDFTGHASYEKADIVANRLLEQFISKEYDLIKFVFNTFKNPAVYIPTSEQFLPILPVEEKNDKVSKAASFYIFEPSEKEIISELIPASLKINFFRVLLESNASEQGARMTAMDKATENAEDLLGELKLTYNKVRQTTITNELLEIVSGANALRG